MTEEIVRSLIADLESERIERTTSFREDKLGLSYALYPMTFLIKGYRVIY